MANTQKSRIFGATKPKRKGFVGYDVLGNITIVKFDKEDKFFFGYCNNQRFINTGDYDIQWI